jgi:hypothetical protein
MFCKVCKDARKSEIEFSSHNVKNDKGNVVCPTLLNQACGYCKEKGHTVKFCSVLQKKNVEETRDARQEARQEAYKRKLDVLEPKPKSKPFHENTFASAFDSDSEEEEEEEEEEEVEVIDMTLKVPIVTTYIRSYMSVLATQKVEPKVVEPKVEPKVYNAYVKGTSWADYDDSDEE